MGEFLMSKYICSDCLHKFDEPNTNRKHTGEIYREIKVCPDCGSRFITSTTKKMVGLQSMLDWMKENGM